jgi:hypothetical protein
MHRYSYFVFIFLFFLASNLSAQTKFLPTVIALYPNEIAVTDSIAQKELNVYKKNGVVTQQLRNEYLRPGLALNWKTIREKELAFMDAQDFFTILTLSVTRELAYREIENRANLLIYPLKQTLPGTLIAYKKIADQHKVSWVMNGIRSEASIVENKRMLKITIQLYNVVTNRVYLDKIYSADSSMLTEEEIFDEVWIYLAEKIQQAIVIDLADKIERNIRHER